MLPVGGPNTGNGHQELKARVIGWIRDELHAAAQGGIGLHVDGATGNLIIDQGEVQSGNYVAGTSGWALQPTGNAEFAGTVNVDGTLNVTGDAEFSGAVTIDGSLTIASGLLQGIT